MSLPLSLSLSLSPFYFYFFSGHLPSFSFCTETGLRANGLNSPTNSARPLAKMRSRFRITSDSNALAGIILARATRWGKDAAMSEMRPIDFKISRSRLRELGISKLGLALQLGNVNQRGKGLTRPVRYASERVADVSTLQFAKVLFRIKPVCNFSRNFL